MGSSSERSDPVEGGAILKGRDVPGDRTGILGMGVSGVRGGVSEYDDCVNTEGGGRNSPGLDVHRGDAAGGVWFECKRVKWDGDCGGKGMCVLIEVVN